MIIKKEEFVKIINSIKETFELSEKITNIIKKSNNDIIRNFCMVPFECHVDNLIKVLSVMFDDESEDIYYFIYELKFGKKYHHGCYTDKNNNNIDLSTPEKLYDRLLKNFNEKYGYVPCNEFDCPNHQTENYIKQKELIKNLSVTDLIKVVDYVDELASFIPQSNEVLDNLYEYTNPITKIFSAAETDKECPNCGNKLYLSDLPQYDYVCPDCDENF